MWHATYRSEVAHDSARDCEGAPSADWDGSGGVCEQTRKVLLTRGGLMRAWVNSRDLPHRLGHLAMRGQIGVY